MSQLRIQFCDYIKSDFNAFIPVRAESGSAGLDLKSTADVEILPGERKMIPTGLKVSFDGNYYLRIAPRSGLALKNGIDVFAGVIDKTYRGEIQVILFNSSCSPFKVEYGMKIAQAIMESISFPEVVVVDELDSTERGEGGFGSTGL